ncbi:MAG: gliding motility-associated ABC transporter substrate-binding protein GldG [Salinivirgaceae bacterium]|jgi:ABC-2 type transport system permease protein|nr:gliding motility-associated ABC transporter substrate-binding protein GldG [Salinivirgaceae bacterium]
MRNKLKRNHILQLLLSIFIIILLGFVSSRLFFRLDLTEDNRYSIHESTQKTLENLDDIIFVKVYLGGDLPAAFKELSSSVLEMLQEFRAYAGANIQYEFINPAESEDEKQRNDIARQLIRKGLNPRTIRVEGKDGYVTKYLFPGAVIVYRQEEVVLNFIDDEAGTAGVSLENLVNDAQSKLEYNFLNKFREAVQIFPKKVGFLHGHGELPRIDVLSLARSLDEMYTVEVIDPQERVYALRDTFALKFDALIIAKPRNRFSEKEKYIVDQYIMHGGRVLWLVDYVDVSMDSLSYASTTNALSLHRELNINDMLFNYGVRINTGIVQDLRAAPIPVNTGAPGGKAQFTPTPWVYFPVIVPTNNHPITKNTGPIRTEFINTIDLVGENPNVKSTVLLKTSEYSRVVSTPTLIDLSIINEKPEPRYYQAGEQDVAVLLEGTFPSVFRNRLVEDFTNMRQFRFKEVSKETKMIVVADGDIAKNPVVTREDNKQNLPLGADKWFEDIFFGGNQAFLLNAINYLTDDNDLVALRGRKLQLRLLDRQKIRENKAMLRTLNIGLPILIILVFAFVFNLIRKMKYGRK